MIPHLRLPLAATQGVTVPQLSWQPLNQLNNTSSNNVQNHNIISTICIITIINKTCIA